MANNRDTILLETVRTHRARLLAAFLYGELAERRVVNENIRRVLGSIILAAVACAGCVGFSLVTSLLAQQAAKAAAQAKQTTGQVTPGVTDQPYGSDFFDRPVKSGWGDADLGGSWQLSGPATAYAVRDGAGIIGYTGGSERSATLPDLVRETSDVLVTVDVPDRGTVTVIGRQVGDADYRGRLSRTDDRVSVSLTSRQDGATKALSDTTTLLDPIPVGTPVKLRLRVFGTSPTTLELRAWAADSDEPSSWVVGASDNFDGLQRSGSVGIAASGVNSGSNRGEIDVLDFVARPVVG